MKKLTIRARLTLMSGGLLFLAGLLVLGVLYSLAGSQLELDRALLPAGADPSGARAVIPESEREVTEAVVRDLRSDTLTSLLVEGGIALVVISAVAIGLGWLITGRQLRPLKRVTATARQISTAPVPDKGLHERIALDGPQDEVKELADTFDVMLEKLDHAFDGQRRFVANASHELRTPLTLNRALLEVAVHRKSASAETRQLGNTLLEINGRHERLIDGLLLLARSERDVGERSYVDFADLVRHVVDAQPTDGVAVHVDAEEAPTAGNPVLLERLVQNLVENAIRYNVPEGGWVAVHTRTNPDGEAELEVSNTGPAVPKYDVPRLAEPFRRLDKDRIAGSQPGAGLGLSIVQAVTRAHGGHVCMEPRSKGGLVVTVTLPGPRWKDERSV